jgi:hypothetical protein
MIPSSSSSVERNLTDNRIGRIGRIGHIDRIDRIDRIETGSTIAGEVVAWEEFWGDNLYGR